MGCTQLLTCVDPPALPAQPLPVEQTGASEINADPGAAETFQRFAIETFSGIRVAQQGARPGFDAQRPVRPARTRRLG